MKHYVVTTVSQEVTPQGHLREVKHRWPVLTHSHQQAIDAVKADKPVGHVVVAVGSSARSKPVWSL